VDLLQVAEGHLHVVVEHLSDRARGSLDRERQRSHALPQRAHRLKGHRVVHPAEQVRDPEPQRLERPARLVL
jgi:hypothetical protein